MTMSTEPAIVRLTSPTQIVAGLPRVLGFTPSESLVVVCCKEPRGRVGLTMRFDLPSDDMESALAADVVRRVRSQQDTSRVLIVIYTDEPDDGIHRPRTALIDRLRLAFSPKLRIIEAALVRNGRFWSYLCEDRNCCPPEGQPMEAAQHDPAITLLDAEIAFRGKATMGSREAIVQSLAGPGADPDALAWCQIALSERNADVLATSERDVAMQDLAGWLMTTERFQNPTATIDDAEMGALAVSLRDLKLRDTLAQVEAPDLEPLLRLLHELCRRTPTGFDAGVCTLYAWLLYCEGGGAEVTILLERVERSQPGYSLARLLGSMLTAQFPPAKVREITRSAAQAL